MLQADSLSVPPHIRSLIDRLNAADYECYVVGGFLRDLLLGRPTHDIDLATSALPEEVMALFSDYRTIPTGLIHGTVTVLAEDDPVEVTTFRKEGLYSDHRRPDEVWFTKSLEEDLKRRDFTINALAWHPDLGLVDPFGGRTDLEDGIIRAVGRPTDRFHEDALRILRALRLASELGFSIEHKTADAMHDKRSLLSHVASERIRIELLRILRAEHFAFVLTKYAAIMTVVLPEMDPLRQEMQGELSRYDIAVERAKRVDDAEQRLAALLYDIDIPEIGKTVAERLRFSNNSVKRIDALVSSRNDYPEADKRSVWRALHRWGDVLFGAILELRRADLEVRVASDEKALKKLDAIRGIKEALLQSGKDLQLSDLAISGHDLLAAGYRGEAIGEALEYLLLRVCVDDLPNRPEVLLAELETRGGEAKSGSPHIHR